MVVNSYHVGQCGSRDSSINSNKMSFYFLFPLLQLPSFPSSLLTPFIPSWFFFITASSSLIFPVPYWGYLLFTCKCFSCLFCLSAPSGIQFVIFSSWCLLFSVSPLDTLYTGSIVLILSLLPLLDIYILRILLSTVSTALILLSHGILSLF